jgi:hypothetical protein
MCVCHCACVYCGECASMIGITITEVVFNVKNDYHLLYCFSLRQFSCRQYSNNNIQYNNNAYIDRLKKKSNRHNNTNIIQRLKKQKKNVPYKNMTTYMILNYLTRNTTPYIISKTNTCRQMSNN